MKTMAIDARVTELLCARLCHDLVSPVSAIGNGVELVTQFGEEMQGEALDLIGDSATNASVRLQFFRLAFGSARGADGQVVSLREARARAVAMLDGGRITVDWPEYPALELVTLSRDGIKLILNLLMAAEEVLRGAGMLGVELEEGGAGLDVRVCALRPGLAPMEEMTRALELETPVEDLTPRTVPAYYGAVLAQALGTEIEMEAGEGRTMLSVTVPYGAGED